MRASRALRVREPEPARQCASCAHFRNDPAYLESAFPGLTSLSSGYGSVRSNDGLCARHELYLGAGAWCGAYLRRNEKQTE
jgi:hypothetical protein